MATKKKAAAPAQANQANLYEVSSGRTRVTYSASSISGKPLLTYKDAKRNLTFTGDEIDTVTTAIGTRVAVRLETVPDLSTLLFGMLVPQVNVGANNEAKVATLGVLITSRTTIGGPGLVKGQVQTYKAIELTGVAKAVEF